MIKDIADFDNEYLGWLKKLPKVIVNPKEQWVTKKSNKQKHYTAKVKDVSGENELEFNIYVRQNLKISDSYSCGISIRVERLEKEHLARYNGSSHSHRNSKHDKKHPFPIIERGTCHIHEASQRAINKKERIAIAYYANPTERYNNIDGALECLLKDYNVTGLVQGTLSL